MPSGLVKGLRVSFSGTWTRHPEYGLQVKADAVEVAVPESSDTRGMASYLATTVPGVGPKTASKLVEALGADAVLGIMNAAAEGDPGAVKKLASVLKGKTGAILSGWSTGRGERAAVDALVELGIRRALAAKAVEAAGPDVVAQVRTNPFDALRGIRGFTFEVLDQLAASMGLASSHPGRVQAAVLERLSDRAAKQGHVYLPLADVTRGALDLLRGGQRGTGVFGGLPEQGPYLQAHPDDVADAQSSAASGRLPDERDIHTALAALVASRKVVVESPSDVDTGGSAAWPSGAEGPTQAMWQHEPVFGGDNGSGMDGDSSRWHPRSRVYVMPLYQDETDIAFALGIRAPPIYVDADGSPMQAPAPPVSDDVAAWMEAQEPPLTAGQRDIIATALSSDACVLTGGPGTGKSFVTAALVRLWRQQGKRVRLCAPTGRAAQRLAQLLSKQGMTCLPAMPPNQFGRRAQRDDGDVIHLDGRRGGASSTTDSLSAAQYYDPDVHDAVPLAVVAPSTVHRLLEFIPRGEKASSGGAEGVDDSSPKSANEDDGAASGDVSPSSSSRLVYEGTFRRNATTPLDCDVLIVDEASMLDVPLAGALFRALPHNASVLLVGDADQLLPVGPGCPLHDILQARFLPSVALTEVVRTAQASLIAASSASILAGRLPPLAPVHVEDEDAQVASPRKSSAAWKLPPPRLPWNATSPGFDASAVAPVPAHVAIKAGCDALWIRLPEWGADAQSGSEEDFGAGDARAAVSALSELIQYTLPAAGWDPTQELQVVSPMRKAAAGSAALCTRLGPLFNPGQQHRVLHRTTSFSPGDRVLQTENDYVRGVFNGDLGVVTAVSPGTGTGARVKSITVDFSNRDSGSAAAQAQQIQTYVGDELAQLVPAWAVTVHKAQGCEFSVVAVSLSNAHGIALQRNSLYTAASRASQLLVVISSKRALMQALANKHQGVRHSHLGQRLLLAAARRTGAKRHYHAAAARRDADEYPPF